MSKYVTFRLEQKVIHGQTVMVKVYTEAPRIEELSGKITPRSWILAPKIDQEGIALPRSWYRDETVK